MNIQVDEPDDEGSPPRRHPGEDSASEVGVEALDLLQHAILECMLVIETLPEEVDMNLDELEAGLRSVMGSARRASGAARILFACGDLDERWGDKPSRPKAVFARHHAQKLAGAPPIVPEESDVEKFFSGVRSIAITGDSPGGAGPSATCSAQTRFNLSCANRVVYLGGGDFAEHCRSHLTGDETARFMELQRSNARRVHQGQTERDNLINELGRMILGTWIARAESENRAWLRPDQWRWDGR